MTGEATPMAATLSRPSLFVNYLSVLLVVGSLLVQSSAALECVDYTGAVCSNAFSAPVSTDDSRTMEYMEAYVSAFARQLTGVSFVSPQCYQAAVEFTCLATFLPCRTVFNISIPTPPCKYMCESANMLCAPFFAQMNFTLPCEGLPVDIYPDPITRQCFNESFTGILMEPCPQSNMLVREGVDGACTQRCPSDYYSRSEEDNLYTAAIVSSWISLVCSILVLITWLLFPIKRAFPSVMVIYIAFGSMMIAIGELMNMKESAGFHCRNDWTAADQSSSSSCLIQGIILHFFPLSIAAWWLCMSANLHQMIVMKNRSPDGMLKYYHGFAWGLPLVLTIISLSTAGFEFDPSGFRVCTLVKESYFNGLFMSWFMIFGIVGLALISHVCFELYKAQKKMKSIGTSNKNIFRAQIRSIIFLTYYYGVGTCLVSLSYMSNDREDEAEDGLVQYFMCIFGLTQVQDLSRCSYSYVIAYNDIMFCVVVVFGQGLFLFLTFMTTNDTIGCWKTLFLYGSTSYDPNSFEGKMGRKTGGSNSQGRASKSYESGTARELEMTAPSQTRSAANGANATRSGADDL